MVAQVKTARTAFTRHLEENFSFGSGIFGLCRCGYFPDYPDHVTVHKIPDYSKGFWVKSKDPMPSTQGFFRNPRTRRYSEKSKGTTKEDLVSGRNLYNRALQRKSFSLLPCGN